ncbi:MAG: Shikimate dehydrogenase (NADP(+)) [Alphaproteobacteria bacterium MarineAlpha5_Bin9]|nr:MAG: Shikimate dehydrogenase (NADP(+)) [Alphaproteobacteria bacterium MarineAlpha5_Bin9]|tara:strand:+ start:29313 stop:30131 length:819 start_codon:yes stop_codon:yes gene_type:complete
MSFKENKDAFVVGDNVSKSLSPTIFKYWFSKYKILSNYTFLETNKNKAKEEILLKLKNKNIRGFNVTIPFKEFLLDFVHSLDPDAASIGAVNCVSIKNEQIFGQNTDWTGFLKTLNRAGFETNKNKSAAIIGFGGAAKAILYGLLKTDLQSVYIFNRTNLEKRGLLEDNKITLLSLNDLTKHLNDVSLIINTIPINCLKGFNKNKLPSNKTIVDIVYSPKETDFLKSFNSSNKKIYGIDMLVFQAAESFKLWYGFLPEADQELFTLLEKKIK